MAAIGRVQPGRCSDTNFTTAAILLSLSMRRIKRMFGPVILMSVTFAGGVRGFPRSHPAAKTIASANIQTIGALIGNLMRAELLLNVDPFVPGAGVGHGL